MTTLTSTVGAPWSASAKLWTTVVLAVWFAIAAAGGVAGWFAAPADQVFRPIVLTVAAPVLAFLALYAGSASFRDFVLSRDIRIVTMLQAMRVIGFTFLPLYWFGVLPGLFAWPAGLGDVAVGVTAPLVVIALMRQPAFAASRRFVIWNLLGLFDFVVAAGTAVLASGAIATFAGPVTSAPMEVWPLNMFPSFLVPLYIFLHLTALFQAAARARSEA